MQSKTEESIAEIEAYDTQTRQPRSFELYQEYSQCNVIEVVRNRRADYDKADKETKRKLEKEVEAEVEDFRAWLEKPKASNIQLRTTIRSVSRACFLGFQ